MEPAKKEGVAQKEATGNKAIVPSAAPPKPDAFDTSTLWLKDNVEAFVVAFIIALVIRCFCLEVFKIPTGSMTPTLLGDHLEPVSSGQGAGKSVPVGGDRIMVSKFMYHLFPLERYDVVVFKFPLDTSRNFIKRLVGLPNEKLLLQQGDLYFCKKGEDRFQIARKPLRVQEAVWIPVSPTRRFGKLNWDWIANPPETATFEDEVVTLDASATVTGQATLTFRETIWDEYEYASPNSSRENRVGDLRLAATVTGGGPGVGVSFRLRSSPDWVEAHLSANGKGILMWEIDGGAKETRLFDSPIGDGKPHDLALLNYDGLALLKIDGKVVASIPYRQVLGSLQKAESGASFVVTGGKATLARITLHRDIYYTTKVRDSVLYPEGTAIEIPDRCYFMLGDNSPGSKDSRVWRKKVVRLKDGRVIRADADPRNFHESGDDIFIERDEFGVEYHFKRSDLVAPVEMAPAEDAVFVREELIVGKAFYVWWPLGRMKLIR